MGDKIYYLTASLKDVSANAQLTLTASLPSCNVSSLAPATSLSCLPLSHNKSKQHLRSVGEGACKSRELSFSHGLLPITPQTVLKCSKKRTSEYSALEQPKQRQALSTEKAKERGGPGCIHTQGIEKITQHDSSSHVACRVKEGRY